MQSEEWYQSQGPMISTLVLEVYEPGEVQINGAYQPGEVVVITAQALRSLLVTAGFVDSLPALVDAPSAE